MLILNSIEKDQKHCERCCIFSTNFLGNFPNHQIIDHDKNPLRNVGLKTDQLGIINLKMFENVKWRGKIGRIDNISELEISMPFPRKINSAINHIVRGLRGLPVLIGVHHVFG